MRLYVVLRYVGLTLLLCAGFMFASLGVSFYYGDDGAIPLLFSGLISFFVGLFPLVFVPRQTNISAKEGYVIVVLAWIAVCLFGSLPYMLYGGEFNLSGAWFEAVSGFTTTGATILNNVEGLPLSILFWRSTTHWIGGVGVVVFAMVVAPSIGGRARLTLSRTEVSSMARQEFQYRSRKMLRVMISVYLGITLMTFAGLVLLGIPVFDSINLSFATVATGGFAITNLSIATYGNFGAEMWIVLMMFVASIHFGMLFAASTGHLRALLRSPVVRFFTLGLLVLIAAITWDLHGTHYDSWVQAFRYASFQAVAVVSTTGFGTADASSWPPLALFLIFMLSFMGGCSGSTGGGIKQDRILIMLKAFQTSIRRQQHPHASIPVKVGRYNLEDSEVNATLLFILLFVFIVLLTTLILAIMGFDIGLGFSSAASCVANVGPSIGAMGFFDSYALYPPLARVVLSLAMLLGRLELFGLLLIFTKATWK
ncbi:MAG: cation transporter [Bacteroidia bacterium]|nr:MAG: cation transporter [Bacteroidia bacterium]